MDKFNIPDDISELDGPQLRIQTADGIPEETRKEIERLITQAVVGLNDTVAIMVDLVEANTELDDRLGRGMVDHIFVLHFHIGPLTVDMTAKANVDTAVWEVLTRARLVQEEKDNSETAETE